MSLAIAPCGIVATTQKQRPVGADISTDKIEESQKSPGFSTKYMDNTVDPWLDFYSYADGGWMKAHPAPPKDKSAYNAFYELHDYNLDLLHKIADDCSADKSAPSGSYSRMVGDFYTSAMDTARIEGLKFSPIEGILQQVSGVKSSDDIAHLIPKLHLAGVGAFFSASSDADQKDSKTYVLYLNQGGLSLPDRDYYLSDQFAKLRDDYRAHVEKMFILKGIPDKQAHEWADAVLEIETDLAKAGRSRVDLRDPEKNYNRTDTSHLDGKYGAIKLTDYMKEIGVPSTKYVVVGQPEFFDSINAEISKQDVEKLKAYLYWKVIHAYAPYMHKDVEEENFDMFGVKIRGQLQQEARWKRAVNMIDSEIGEALGKIYVDKHFDANASKEAGEMVSDIISAYKEKLQKATWMSDVTRQKALDKLDKLNVKIGYPTKFRDYSGLVIDPEDYVGNIRRSDEFELRREAARVGKPVDKTEWSMTPPTVNAYYSPTDNEIVFPAGILQPPFFDPKMDPAVNYGAIGAVIGHEITHGFDDQGRLYDADGNLHEWWTPTDEKEFKARADSVVKAYSAQEPLPNVFVNGELTLGENIADMGGVSIAYDALQKRFAKDPSAKKSEDGLTPEQRFFIAYAQVWREVITNQELRKDITTDPHSPARCRATIPVINHPEFEVAFPPKTAADKAQVPKEKIGVW